MLTPEVLEQQKKTASTSTARLCLYGLVAGPAAFATKLFFDKFIFANHIRPESLVGSIVLGSVMTVGITFVLILNRNKARKIVEKEEV